MSISKEKFKEMLREKGLKVTNQRILVLEVLADHRDKHLTAEDIYELVREDYPDWQPFTEQCSCYWKCNWWIVSVLTMDVHVMKSENSLMEKKDIIITI
mgnify:CR=1 FL=1